MNMSKITSLIRLNQSNKCILNERTWSLEQDDLYFQEHEEIRTPLVLLSLWGDVQMNKRTCICMHYLLTHLYNRKGGRST